ncbi:hypothetical protein SAMN06309944_0219 [Micrococcales bacterium KH10]|nr:hypothetical protein SAMN06309944_0219 [Micrococcales bacterium KH10]
MANLREDLTIIDRSITTLTPDQIESARRLITARCGDDASKVLERLGINE